MCVLTDIVCRMDTFVTDGHFCVGRTCVRQTLFAPLEKKVSPAKTVYLYFDIAAKYFIW